MRSEKIEYPHQIILATQPEGMNITGVTGITEATIVTLKALGAIED